MIRGRRVLLAVTGGVAAFKVATLARMLLERGAEVRAVMTAPSLRFLGANTMAAITGRPVITATQMPESMVSRPSPTRTRKTANTGSRPWTARTCP